MAHSEFEKNVDLFSDREDSDGPFVITYPLSEVEYELVKSFRAELKLPSLEASGVVLVRLMFKMFIKGLKDKEEEMD